MCSSDLRPGDARVLGRGPRQPGQRGGAGRRAGRQAGGRPCRVRGGEGQGHDGCRTPVHGHVRRRKAAHRLSRGRTRHRRPARAGERSDPQGDDHSARARAGHGDASAGGRPPVATDGQMHGRPCGRHGRPDRRGVEVRPAQDLLRRIGRHQDGDRPRDADGDRVGHEREARHAATARRSRRSSSAIR